MNIGEANDVVTLLNAALTMREEFLDDVGLTMADPFAPSLTPEQVRAAAERLAARAGKALNVAPSHIIIEVVPPRGSETGR